MAGENPKTIITEWQEKLEFLLKEEAQLADPEQKFRIRKLIEGVSEKLREFRTAPVSPPLPRDAESQSQARKLEDLYERKRDLALAGKDVTRITKQINDIRSLLHRGPLLRPGDLLADGRFKLGQIIGQGGFATVWQAADREGHVVALKVLHAHHGQDSSRRERFFRGAREMADLRHQHIVAVLEAKHEEGGWHFFVMEYVKGNNFEEAVLAGTLTCAEQLSILRQAGDALVFAHERGVVHRDVKPSNILIDNNVTAKLTDFDLARADESTGFTATHAMLGTLQFAAPEALHSAAEADMRADIYSLASTAVFALFDGRMPATYYRDPAQVIARLPHQGRLRQVLTRATSFERQRRPVSVAEFCKALAKAWPPVKPTGEHSKSHSPVGTRPDSDATAAAVEATRVHHLRDETRAAEPQRVSPTEASQKGPKRFERPSSKKRPLRTDTFPNMKSMEKLAALPKAGRALRQVLGALRQENRGAKVLVVGNTGTGKTAVVNNLLNPYETLPPGSTREAAVVLAEPVSSVRILLVDTPGNELYHFLLEEHLDEIATGGVMGVVNVVSYGYNDPQARKPESDHPPAYLREQVNSDYLKRQRLDDLRYLDRWLISNTLIHDSIRWIITVVNKYDLWQEEYEDVIGYYGASGEYGRKILNILGEGDNYCVVASCAAKTPRGFRARILEGPVVPDHEIRLRNLEFISKFADNIGAAVSMAIRQELIGLNGKTKLEIKEPTLKDDARSKLRNLLNTFRPIRWLEISGLLFFSVFFVYMGFRLTGLLESLDFPAWIVRGDWQFWACIIVAVLQLLTVSSRHLIRINYLKPEINRLVDALGEVHDGRSESESLRGDTQLVRDTLNSAEPALFRGAYATLWSVILALAFIVIAILGIFRS